MKIFSKNDNSFICQNCKKQVEKLGYSSRNHCPYCLHSLHVDINPGDRENNCKGLLKPTYIEIDSKKGYVINFKCEKCGAKTRNKKAEDDNINKILEIFKSQ